MKMKEMMKKKYTGLLVLTTFLLISADPISASHCPHLEATDISYEHGGYWFPLLNKTFSWGDYEIEWEIHNRPYTPDGTKITSMTSIGHKRHSLECVYRFTTNDSPEDDILEISPMTITPAVGPMLKPLQTQHLITEYLNNKKPSVQEGNLDWKMYAVDPSGLKHDVKKVSRSTSNYLKSSIDTTYEVEFLEGPSDDIHLKLKNPTWSDWKELLSH